MIDDPLVEALLESLINRSTYHLKTSNAHIGFSCRMLVPYSPITTFKGVNSMILTSEEKVSVVINAITPAGNPARFDGVPVWEVSDPMVAAVFPSPDGLSAEIHSVDFGQAMVTVTCDADLDVGEVRELVGMVDITVVEPEAVSMTVSTGAPTLK